MKKFFTIPVTILLLLSGMHFSIASHYCNGELSAVKLSQNGKAASCGMVHDNEISSETTFSAKCCEDKTSVYRVDDNYFSSEFNPKLITGYTLLHFDFARVSSYSFTSFLTNYTTVSPPNYYLANSTTLADICVFRI
jgi:hypothetical protein